VKTEIVIDIDSSGKQITLEVKGEQGRQCLETTHFLEEVLGERERRSLKSAYFAARGQSRIAGRVSTRERGE